ncbi:MAG: SCO1664 family protein [Ilumatobacteraceae bacterium]
MPEDELTHRPGEVSVDELRLHELRLESLHAGAIDIEGRMPWSSNATFLVNVSVPGGDERAGQAIYKPLRGERPLWDFEPGLYRREVAAYLLSEEMGLRLVPATIVRDGPLGEGSMQWFVDADHQEHYFTIYERCHDLHDRLRLMAVLDIVANNADRKSGHCLLATDGTLWGIDHGLCFSADFKLRTVIWEFGGEALPAVAVKALKRLAESVPLAIAALLADDEVVAIQRRAAWLLEQGEFPIDGSGRRYPWPLV